MLKTTLELLERSLAQLHRSVADFTADDFYVRAAPNANHTCWILGHLAQSETNMMRIIKPDFESAIPEEWKTLFSRGTCSTQERCEYPSGEEVLAACDRTRSATIAALKEMADSDLAREVPSPFAPGTNTTVDFLILMPAMHSSMHVGQIQVIRRLLGKPVLY